MKHRNPTLPILLILSFSIFLSLLVSRSLVTSQTRERRVTPESSNNERVTKAPALPGEAEIVKVDVDLVTVDALVLQKNTARVVGGLRREDFLLYEDGVKQEITHFGQDSLPLSVLLLIDRGGCLDPFGGVVHRAASDADRLRRVSLPAEHHRAEAEARNPNVGRAEGDVIHPRILQNRVPVSC